jgi:hypothetical protein
VLTISNSLNVRTQFTLISDDHTLSKIFNEIAEEGININGIAQFKIKGCNHVKMVVGTTTTESIWDIRVVKSILRKHQVDFEVSKIIHIIGFTPDEAGQLAPLYNALWCRVDVIAIYNGEDHTLYIETCEIDKALVILAKDPLPKC